LEEIDGGFVESLHQEQTLAQQQWFKPSVNRLIDTYKARNPFDQDSDHIFNIESGEISSQAVSISMKTLEELGKN
jgi:hypothetical protein